MRNVNKKHSVLSPTLPPTETSFCPCPVFVAQYDYEQYVTAYTLLYVYFIQPPQYEEVFIFKSEFLTALPFELFLLFF